MDYITIDGLVVTNVCRLCQAHHADLTSPVGGHRAAIRYMEGRPWVWCVPFKQRAGCRLSEDELATLDTSPTAAGALYRTARGGVWQMAGTMRQSTPA